jgi:hypothetical protein
MTIILGLDGAQCTGFAYYDTQRSLASIRAGLIRATGESYEEKAIDLHRKLLVMMREQRPDFVAIEMPLRAQPGGKRVQTFMGEAQEVEGGSGVNAVISSNQMVSALACAAGAKGIPRIVIAVNSWRPLFYGKGFKPPMNAVKERGKIVQKPDWKGAAVAMCAQLKIPVPNHDAAEAVGIAFAASGTPAFKKFCHDAQQERTAA